VTFLIFLLCNNHILNQIKYAQIFLFLLNPRVLLNQRVTIFGRLTCCHHLFAKNLTTSSLLPMILQNMNKNLPMTIMSCSCLKKTQMLETRDVYTAKILLHIPIYFLWAAANTYDILICMILKSGP
jgi:hypothetical protein